MSRIKTLKGGSGGRELIQSRARYRRGGVTKDSLQQLGAHQGGCTEPWAINYNTGATIDNGSCKFPRFNWIISVVYDPDTYPGNGCEWTDELHIPECEFGYINRIGFSPEATEDIDHDITYGDDWCCNQQGSHAEQDCSPEAEHRIRCYPNVFDIYPGDGIGCNTNDCLGIGWHPSPGSDIQFMHSYWFDFVSNQQHQDGLGPYGIHISHSDQFAPPHPGAPVVSSSISGTTGNSSGNLFYIWWWPYEPEVERETFISIQFTEPEWTIHNLDGVTMYLDTTPYGGTEINNWNDVQRWFESIRLTDAFGGSFFDIDLMDQSDIFIPAPHTTVILKTVLRDISAQRRG
jgi:hypothetical protein